MFSSLKVLFLGGPQRTSKFTQNNCLTVTNNFLHCEFQLSIFSGLKVSFWGGHFEVSPLEKTLKFGQNN